MTSWLKPGNTAVITGAANGIGLAAAKRFVAAGMNVMIADRDEDRLADAAAELAAQDSGAVSSFVCDVSDYTRIEALRDATVAEFGSVHCLMNNAGAGIPARCPWEDLAAWKQQLDINLWGIVHGCHAFIPGMLEAGGARAVINTGSKQGITNPPGNYAYNLSKAGVKNYTESLAHALREHEGSEVSAHLLIPGFTYTGMIARFLPEKPDGAWTPDQAVEFMLDSLANGDFYILCPDNETPRALDEKRILWNTGDLTENRSALSRWDPAYQSEFERYMTD